MENFLLILICLLSGVALQKVKSFPKGAHIALNAFIIYFCLPAVAFKFVPFIQFEKAYALPYFSSWIVWLGSWLVFTFLGNQFRWEPKTTATLILMSGLGNTSFIGFPLIEAFYGADFIRIALFADQGGFLVLSTVGIATALGGGISGLQLMRKMVAFPPFIAFIAALALQLVDLPMWWEPLMSKLSSPLVPLALVSVGLQLRLGEKYLEGRKWILSLFYKLIAAPLVVGVLYVFLLNDRSVYAHISIVESAMAPMVTAFVLVSQHNLNVALAARIIGVGIPLSLLTTSAWWSLLKLL